MTEMLRAGDTNTDYFTSLIRPQNAASIGQLSKYLFLLLRQDQPWTQSSSNLTCEMFQCHVFESSTGRENGNQE